MKAAFSFHPQTGVFVGVNFAQESPLEPGVFLLPAGATFVEPPQVSDNQQAVWLGDSWGVQDILAPEPPGLVIPTGTTPEPEILQPELLTWDRIRAQRNQLLSQSDWTQLADAPLSPEQKQAWAAYRQALRDVPSSFTTPEEVVWPEIP
jgi:hypothetical protein